MALIDPKLPKKYKNQKVLFEQNLDAWRKSTETALSIINLNLTQVGRDLNGNLYDFNNAGNQSIFPDIQTQINNIVSGATPITGTTSDTWSINTDGKTGVLDTVNLTGTRSFLLSDASGNIPSLPTPATTQTGTGAIVRQQTPTINTPTINTPVIVGGSGSLPPVGTIIAHYDYNGAIAVDATYWRYCDGTAAVTISGIGAQTLPDLSNRYLVGFGTEGGGDIDTAAWNVAAVGNASHQVNLQHVHDMGHNHADTFAFTVDAHTHTGPSHTHGAGSLQFKTFNLPANGDYTAYDAGGASVVAGPQKFYDAADGGSDFYGWEPQQPLGTAAAQFYTKDGTGTTAADGTGNTGNASVNTTTKSGSVTAFAGNTGNGGSTTQNIQPRSVRVRFIIRIL